MSKSTVGFPQSCTPTTSALVIPISYFEGRLDTLLQHYRIERLYLDFQGWTRKAILNIAHSGKSSSDRTIQE